MFGNNRYMGTAIRISKALAGETTLKESNRAKFVE